MQAYLCPFSNPENPYIELQKKLLRDAGYQVRPLSVRSLVLGQCSGLLRRENLVAVHWLENRLFRTGASPKGLSLTGTLSFLLLGLALMGARSRVLYYIHNHSVHDLEPRLAGLGRLAIRFLRSISDVRVVHDPSFTHTYDAQYIPHPLYWEGAPPPARKPMGPAREPDFIILGALRPYKRIHELLSCWTSGVRLRVLGGGPDADVRELQSIVSERGLADVVEIEPRRPTDEEFSHAIDSHDVVVLPHCPGANLVTGGFFAALGRSKGILARETPFMTWVRELVPAVYTFNDAQELRKALETIAEELDSIDVRRAREKALELFGTSACVEALKEALASKEKELSDRKDVAGGRHTSSGCGARRSR